MRNITGILTAIFVMALCVFTPASADDDSNAKEYQVKVAFLYNFIKFVQWPGAQALEQTHAANICIMGQDAFGSALDIFKQASTPQLGLNVKRDVQIADISRCHILFVSHNEADNIAAIVAAARPYPVLTVSEIPGFADHGGIIEMARTQKNIGLFSKDKINLRINVKAAESKGLRIDAQLLEIAAEVIK